MVVLLTRPRADSQRIADALAADGIETRIWPLTRIEPVGGAIVVPGDVEALVFSSGHAVRQFEERSTCRDLPAFCVGNRTAELAQDAGMSDVLSADGDFAALVARIVEAAPARVLYLRGERVSSDLTAALAPHGIGCTEQILYRASPGGAPPARLDSEMTRGDIAAVTVWSSHHGRLLNDSLKARPDWNIAGSALVGISENAVADLANRGFRRIFVASRPNATQMIAEIRAALR